ncbi:SAV_2336 N-terminal domain-related protein [Nocardia sp. NPDC055321]
MESKLLELLAALDGLDLDGELIAEALWLSEHIGDQPADPPAASGPSQPPDEPPAASAWAAPSVDSVALVPRNPFVDSLSGRSGWVPAHSEVGVPVPSPLGESERIRAELRPLAGRFPEPRQRIFDEEASVEHTARTGIPWPVTRSGLVRQRDAVLVFDRHPSMAAWSGLAAAVRAVVESVGFRRVESWYLDEDAQGGLRLAADVRAPADRPVSALRDPSGRRVIMVFSACLGNAWGWGEAAAELEALATASPVTIVQPLPNSLWARTGLDWGRGRITPMLADSPSPLRVLAGTGGRTLPIPVLELTPGWIAPWAQLLAGYRRIAGYPLLQRPEPGGEHARPDTLAVRQDAELGNRPLDRVRRFRSASSPEAFRLAACLAQVPLLLPIMRLVQQAVLPGTKPSVLAEVLAGGLIEAGGAAPAAPYTMAEENRSFAFRPGVEAILREAVPRSEAARVLTAVSRFVAERYGVPGQVFPATLSDPADSDGSSFAYLSPDVLRRIAPNFPESPPEPPNVEQQRRYADLARTAFTVAEFGELDEALTSTRAALATVPVGHEARFELLRMLAVLLHRRWQRDRDANDLDEAIAVSKMAMKEGPDSDAEFAAFATFVGELLLQRYSAVGGVDYLTDGTRVLRAALDDTDPEDPVRPRLCERLADAYLMRCEAASEPLHGWQAVDLYAAAAESIEDETGDANAVLLLKITRAYLHIAEVSAYPEDDLPDRVIEQFRYAAALLSVPRTAEVYVALLKAVRVAARAAEHAAVPAGLPVRMSEILAGVSVGTGMGELADARNVLDSVRTDSG